MMASRADDLLRQAKHNLEVSRKIIPDGFFDMVCFHCQQAAEFAVKALFNSINGEAWGHIVYEMIEELPDDLRPDEELRERVRILDRYYIPTRYVNSHDKGAPMDHYGPEDAKEAIEIASAIYEFCESKIR